MDRITSSGCARNDRITRGEVNQVEETVREKLRCFKLWKAGGIRAAYNAAKRTSNCEVHHARSEVEKVVLQKIEPRSRYVYRLAKQMRPDNRMAWERSQLK